MKPDHYTLRRMAKGTSTSHEDRLMHVIMGDAPPCLVVVHPLYATAAQQPNKAHHCTLVPPIVTTSTTNNFLSNIIKDPNTPHHPSSSSSSATQDMRAHYRHLPPT